MLSRIDVTVATKNNEATLARCLSAIRENIPVNHLVVVDGGSTDKTLDIARRFNAKIVTERGLLGRVRYRQCEECCTDWIAFVDSDVYVYPTWWITMSRHIAHKNGMIVGIGESSYPSRTYFYERYFNYNAKRYGLEAFSNTLVKRALLLSCKALLDGVHAGEDTIFAKYVKAQGKLVVTVDERGPICYHDKHADMPYAFFRSGQSIGMSGDFMRAFRVLPNNLRNWIAYSKSVSEFDPRLMAYIIYLWIALIRGFFASWIPTCKR
jgi:glycosyltransferase involved in cell wall biosynthesis